MMANVIAYKPRTVRDELMGCGQDGPPEMPTEVIVSGVTMEQAEQVASFASRVMKIWNVRIEM